MAYGNYAPFYRTGYFNPMQQSVPNMAENQFTQPYQMSQQMPQQMQAPTIQSNNERIWVLNEQEAVSFPVAPNTCVILWDKSNSTIYEKSVNAQGVPSMRILDFKERTENAQNAPENHACKCGDKFVTKEAFNVLNRNFEDLRAKVDEITEKPKSKAKKQEDE